MKTLPQIVELTTFTKDAQKVLSADEQEWLATTLAANPNQGVRLIRNLRKIRVPIGGKGKRGGARVVYAHVSASNRVHLLAVFAKNERANLTKVELEALADLAKQLE